MVLPLFLLLLQVLLPAYHPLAPSVAYLWESENRKPGIAYGQPIYNFRSSVHLCSPHVIPVFL